MAHIFISYKSDDGDFADILKDKLEKAGFTVWIDEQLVPGEDWREAIDSAIRTASALVVIVTPAAKASEYVTYEWSFAQGAGIPVIPVILKQTELHPRLESRQYLDFTQRRSRPWTKLIGCIKDILSSSSVTDEQIKELLEDLARGQWKVRLKAVMELGHLRAEAAIPYLIHALKYDRSKKVRQAAAEALEQIGGDFREETW